MNFNNDLCIIVDCTYSSWSTCSKTCGNGVQTRHVVIPQKYGGKCDGASSMNCFKQNCPSKSNLFVLIRGSKNTMVRSGQESPAEPL